MLKNQTKPNQRTFLEKKLDEKYTLIQMLEIADHRKSNCLVTNFPSNNLSKVIQSRDTEH